MPVPFHWWLLLGSSTCSGFLAAACSPSAVSCTETATCAPNPRKEGGADAIDEAGESDAGFDADVSIDVPEPPLLDVSVDSSIDASMWDSEGGASDHRDRDGLDVPDISDSSSEPDACDPGTSKSPVDSACLIDERYGVFVSPQGSDMTGAGTRRAPYKTIARALQGAKGTVMRVYACDEGTGFGDALTIDATLDGMSLYGGFECATWSYATSRRARVHPASGVAVNVKRLIIGLTVEDFEFDAADGAVGESSIGGIIESSINVVLRGVKIVAGKGGGGAKGVDGDNGDDAPAAGTAQQGSPAMCPAQFSQQNGGSWGGPSVCGSRGGNGGQANQGLGGGNGVGGIPTTGLTDPNLGTGGAPGGDGLKGSDGSAGISGEASSAKGSFSATGYVAAPPGGDGTDGHAAQGGGGGGASNASGLCIGASGGAGGVGGCGGFLGTGGGSAGASIALLTWMSTVTLDQCELTSAVGGAGGVGGNGGKGGTGKSGAAGGYGSDAGSAPEAGAEPARGGNGGPGGNGGNGGSGAGGHGGPSYALVYKGAAPFKLNGTILARGAGGAKGTGGSIDGVKAPDGLAGEAADDFAVP